MRERERVCVSESERERVCASESERARERQREIENRGMIRPPSHENDSRNAT